jgi:hypothetical protein
MEKSVLEVGELYEVKGSMCILAYSHKSPTKPEFRLKQNQVFMLVGLSEIEHHVNILMCDTGLMQSVKREQFEACVYREIIQKICET